MKKKIMILKICQGCNYGSEKDKKSYCSKEACYAYLTKCIQSKALDFFLKINSVSNSSIQISKYN